MGDLKAFIWKVKKSIYAENADHYVQGGLRHTTFKDGFYHFENQEIGHRYYSGHEVIYKKDEPIWTMVYSGGILNDDIGEKRLLSFLRRALVAEERTNILRGPSFYQEEHLLYLNEFYGGIDRFSGREYIRFGTHIIYELHYSGGLLD